MAPFVRGDICWGVIGAGKVCEIKSVPGLMKTPHSGVRTVMSRTKDRVRDFARRHSIPFWTTDVEDILNDPAINAVYIATPPETHCHYCLKAANAGKAVYVEKPMARNHSECQIMIAACRKAGVPIYTAYYRRGLPHFNKIRDLIRKNVIGNVRCIQIDFIRPLDREKHSDIRNNWRVQPKISGGGYFHDLASHQLDLLDYFFGPVRTAHGICRNQADLYPAHDMVSAVLELPGNILCSGSWCFTADKISYCDSIRIIGEKGHLDFSTFMHSQVRIVTADHEQTLDFPLPKHIQQPFIELMTKELRGKGSCPGNGETAARTSYVMDLICMD